MSSITLNGSWLNPHYVPPARKEKRVTHNDEERRQWVLNDEGLYRLQRCSRLSMKEWIKQNRTTIDEVIDNVNSGKKNAHYLVYG